MVTLGSCSPGRAGNSAIFNSLKWFRPESGRTSFPDFSFMRHRYRLCALMGWSLAKASAVRPLASHCSRYCDRCAAVRFRCLREPLAVSLFGDVFIDAKISANQTDCLGGDFPDLHVLNYSHLLINNLEFNNCCDELAGEAAKKAGN